MVAKLVSVPPIQRFTVKGSVFPDDFLGLAFRSYKKDILPGSDRIGRELARLLELLIRFLEVDDRNSVSMIKEERFEVGIPTANLVAEVDAGIKEVFRCDVHGSKPQ